MEPRYVVFRAPLDRREYVVFAVVIVSERMIELAIAGCGPGDDGLRNRPPLRMDWNFGDLDLGAVDAVIPEDMEEPAPELVIVRREWLRLHRPLQ
jgi:hypothetical protein